AATSLRMDKLLKYELEGEDGPRWLHVEIQASPTSDMPLRMFLYWSRAFAAFRPLSSLLICLKPGERRGDPESVFIETGPDGSELLRFGFSVTRAWNLDAHDLLASGPPGLLPLIPFAKGVTPSIVERAHERLSAVVPVPHGTELQGVLATFAQD